MELALPLTVIISFIFLAIGFFAGNFFSNKKGIKNIPLQKEDRQKEVFEEITQVIKDGVLLTNSAEQIVWANRKALEILKASWTLTQNKPISQILPKTQNTNQHTYQVKLTTLDAEELDIKVQTYPLSKLMMGTIYVITDVTEQIVLEEMKLNFVAIAAHQLRTPLTAIKGYLFILKNSITPKLNAEEKGFLESTIIGVERMGFLIENLLNLSKIEKGELKVNLKPIDIDNVIEQTIEGLLPGAKEKNISLVMGESQKPYPVLMGDLSLLIEALSNIVGNGIKYSDQGGQVMIDVEKQPDGVSIHVSDKGKGISAEAQPRLFQKFYGATKSLTELSSGLGLGLFISKSIIDAHKGKIWVNSLEGHGTTVSIFLPFSS